MINLVKTISSELNSLSQRIVKVLRYGRSDVQTATESGPFGIDSMPVKNLIAVYAETKQKGETVIVGYLLRDKVADLGETRIFSTNAAGVFQTYIWLKNNGDIHFAGDDDNLVRFAAVKATIEELQNDIANLKSAFNGWTPVPNDGGAALKAASLTWAGTALSEDINEAKIDEFKCL
jgi:hypothetical protein